MFSHTQTPTLTPLRPLQNSTAATTSPKLPPPESRKASPSKKSPRPIFPVEIPAHSCRRPQPSIWHRRPCFCRSSTGRRPQPSIPDPKDPDSVNLEKTLDALIAVLKAADVDAGRFSRMGLRRNISGQEFSEMYCVVLIVQSVVVSAALLRIFGREVVELPLVATARENQGKGYFQALFTCIERLLSSMSVKHLVLPAAEEAKPTWTNKLGFSKISNEQTGSGKSYTIWGASNALFEEEQQGLAPRVFERLFERIAEEQTKQADKQLVYMCRCSFLEIYNEQITDLLDPSQKNLQSPRKLGFCQIRCNPLCSSAATRSALYLSLLSRFIFYGGE